MVLELTHPSNGPKKAEPETRPCENTRTESYNEGPRQNLPENLQVSAWAADEAGLETVQFVVASLTRSLAHSRVIDLYSSHAEPLRSAGVAVAPGPPDRNGTRPPHRLQTLLSLRA